MLGVRELLHIRLKLLQQDQAKSNECLWLDSIQILCLFHLIYVQENIVLPLQQGRFLLNKRLDEFGQQQNDFAVPIPDADHLLEELLVFFLLKR